MKCWASSISPCCSTQSREHYLTKGLFSGKMIRVEGLPFLKDGSAEIAKSSLTKKCLCKSHNSQLSPYDDEAIAFGKALKYALKLGLRRRNSKSKKFSVHNKVIDYDKFCRWLIKTFLGFLDFFNYPSLVDEQHLANLVFSDKDISDYVKLTISMSINEDFRIDEIVAVQPLYIEQKTAGFRVEFYGVRIEAIFSDNPQHKQEPLRIRFNEYPNRPSCVVRIG